MKRLGAFSLAFLFITNLIPASFAVTPGTSCLKAGQTSTENNKKFTCIKLGSKLYWDNGVSVGKKVSNLPVKDVKCTEAIAGRLSVNNSTRCVMVDDLFQGTSGTYEKLFEYRPKDQKPESTLCRHDEQFWSNQTWYDGTWKCGYFVDGAWSAWGWHKGPSQYPNAIKTQYVIDKSKVANSQSTSTNTPQIICNTNSNQVRSSFGSVLQDGFNMSAYIFENISSCNLSISASVKFLCPDGGVLKETNSITSTGMFPLAPKQKLSVTNGMASRYFPQALQQCYMLTGYRSNLVFFSNIYNPSPQIMVLTSQP